LPIGLDIGSTALRMLQLRGAGDGLAVAAAGRCELPADLKADSPERPAVLIEAIKQLLASAPFEGRRIVLAFPDVDVQYKNIRMPSMPPNELAQAVRWEAAERFGDNGG